MEFSIVRTECPRCGCKDTLAQAAIADEPESTRPKVICLEAKMTPLTDFTGISTPTSRILMRYMDECSKCGHPYCTRADKISLPTEMVLKMMGLQMQAVTR